MQSSGSRRTASHILVELIDEYVSKVEAEELSLLDEVKADELSFYAELAAEEESISNSDKATDVNTETVADLKVDFPEKALDEVPASLSAVVPVEAISVSSSEKKSVADMPEPTVCPDKVNEKKNRKRKKMPACDRTDRPCGGRLTFLNWEWWVKQNIGVKWEYNPKTRKYRHAI